MPTKLAAEFADRTPLEATRPDLAVIIAGTVKVGFKVERGDVLGLITAAGLLRRRSRTNAAGAGFAVDSAVGHVVDASVFVADDVLTNAAGANIGTVQAVDPVANTVTLTGNAAVAVAAGAAVLGSDGSQIAQAISDDETDGTGDTPIGMYIGGLLKEAKLRGLDVSAKTELSGASKVGGIFKF